jgi:hypothetical protein
MQDSHLNRKKLAWWYMPDISATVEAYSRITVYAALDKE